MDRVLNPIVSLLLAFVLDLILGDPRWLYHPVRIIGWGIENLEKMLRRLFPSTRSGELMAGIFLACIPPVCSGGLCILLIWSASQLHWIIGLALETFLCYQMLAVRSLRDESMRVFTCLQEKDIQAARQAVSRIVGRDTDKLNESEIAKATVECIAESTNDGIVAPLFYAFLGGAPLLFAFKAVNTLDSMVGYKNNRYLYLGKASAIMDDIWGYIPARIAGICMVFAAVLAKEDIRGAKRIFWRDRQNHSSPNSAYTEAACAGALQIQLGGSAYYFGKRIEKPTIGDAIRPIVPQDIPRANHLMFITSILALLFFCGLKIIVLL